MSVQCVIMDECTILHFLTWMIVTEVITEIIHQIIPLKRYVHFSVYMLHLEKNFTFKKSVRYSVTCTKIIFTVYLCDLGQVT